MYISVIIPVYNGEKFIARAIDSVLKQTLPADEIIVINDGSKDGTEKILEQYAGKIMHKTIPNGGVSNARNEGIAMSHGQWVAFLDADDIWYPAKLMRQFALLTQYPSVGFCCCNFKIYNSNIQQVTDHFSSYPNHIRAKFDSPLKDSLGFLIEENFVGTASNVVVRQDILKKTGKFNTSYRLSEDYDLWLRCALYTEFLFMSEVLLDKDTHGGNLTNSQIENCQCHNRVLKSFLELQTLEVKQKKLQRAIGLALAAKHYQIGGIYYEQGAKSDAFRSYWEGLKASFSLKNIFDFLGLIARKFLRTLSAGLISRKNFKSLLKFCKKQ